MLRLFGCVNMPSDESTRSDSQPTREKERDILNNVDGLKATMSSHLLRPVYKLHFVATAADNGMCWLPSHGRIKSSYRIIERHDDLRKNLKTEYKRGFLKRVKISGESVAVTTCADATCFLQPAMCDISAHDITFPMNAPRLASWRH